MASRRRPGPAQIPVADAADRIRELAELRDAVPEEVADPLRALGEQLSPTGRARSRVLL
jgi:hypothetical protein